MTVSFFSTISRRSFGFRRRVTSFFFPLIASPVKKNYIFIFFIYYCSNFLRVLRKSVFMIFFFPIHWELFVILLLHRLKVMLTRIFREKKFGKMERNVTSHIKKKQNKKQHPYTHSGPPTPTRLAAFTPDALFILIPWNSSPMLKNYVCACKPWRWKGQTGFHTERKCFPTWTEGRFHFIPFLPIWQSMEIFFSHAHCAYWLFLWSLISGPKPLVARTILFIVAAVIYDHSLAHSAPPTPERSS